MNANWGYHPFPIANFKIRQNFKNAEKYDKMQLTVNELAMLTAEAKSCEPELLHGFVLKNVKFKWIIVKMGTLT